MKGRGYEILCYIRIDCFCSGGLWRSGQTQIHFASENSIALKYSAWDLTPTVTAEALDMAISHCASHGKGMKLVSSNAVSMYTSEEIHTFMCTNDLVDERIEVKVK